MPFPPKNILAPTDFSEGASPAVAYAFEVAKAVGAKVHLLHAYAMPAFPEDGGRTNQLIAELKLLGEKSLRGIADRHQASGNVGQLLLEMGDPRDVIGQCLPKLDIDLVVMGTHGRRGLARMILGSVAGYVIRTASCPVLVIPAADRR